MRDGTVIFQRPGEIRFSSAPGFNLDPDGEVEWMAAEQSNSTMVLGRKAVLKLLRKVAPGAHPDVEMVRYLTDNDYEKRAADAGNGHAARERRGYAADAGPGVCLQSGRRLAVDRWISLAGLPPKPRRASPTTRISLPFWPAVGRYARKHSRPPASDPDSVPEPVSRWNRPKQAGRPVKGPATRPWASARRDARRGPVPGSGLPCSTNEMR